MRPTHSPWPGMALVDLLTSSRVDRRRINKREGEAALALEEGLSTPMHQEVAAGTVVILLMGVLDLGLDKDHLVIIPTNLFNPLSRLSTQTRSLRISSDSKNSEHKWGFRCRRPDICPNPSTRDQRWHPKTSDEERHAGTMNLRGSALEAISVSTTTELGRPMFPRFLRLQKDRNLEQHRRQVKSMIPKMLRWLCLLSILVNPCNHWICLPSRCHP